MKLERSMNYLIKHNWFINSSKSYISEGIFYDNFDDFVKYLLTNEVNIGSGKAYKQLYKAWKIYHGK